MLYISGENFEELYHTADRLKNNPSEKQLLFPEFADGELIIGDDEWGVPTSPPQPVHCEHILHEPLLSRDAYHQSSSIPLTSSAHSPPPPVTPTEPTSEPQTHRGFRFLDTSIAVKKLGKWRNMRGLYQASLVLKTCCGHHVFPLGSLCSEYMEYRFGCEVWESGVVVTTIVRFPCCQCVSASSLTTTFTGY